MKKLGVNVVLAKIMEKVARKSVEVVTDNRCMYIFHQPKMPENLRRNK
jgi:cyclic lactone autoinducer peptide